MARVTIYEKDGEIALGGTYRALKIFEQSARIGLFCNEGLCISYAHMAKIRGIEPEKFKRILLEYIRGHLRALESAYRLMGEPLEIEWKVNE